MATFDEAMSEVRQQIEDDLHRYAIETLAALLDDETVDLDTEQRRRILQITYEIWVALDDGATKVYTELTDALAAAAAAPDDAEKVYQAAYQLIERRSPALAAGLLSRAWAAHPTQIKLLHELVAARELQGAYARAVDVLREPAAQSSAAFLTRYLFAFNAILAGDLAAGRAMSRNLDPGGSDRHEFMVARLEDVLLRADFIGSVATDRDRQFIHSGSLLVDRDLTTQAREESWQDYGTRLVALRDVLTAIDRRPARVVSLRSARKDALAHAAATIFGVPFVESYLPEGEGLFVSDDLAAHQADIAAALRAHQPRQLYYAHLAPVARELPVAADAIGTRATEAIILPWDRWTRLDYSRADRPKGPPTETPEQLGGRMAEAATAPNDIAELVAFARRAHQAALLSLGHDTGSRERLWVWPAG